MYQKTIQQPLSSIPRTVSEGKPSNSGAPPGATEGRSAWCRSMRPGNASAMSAIASSVSSGCPTRLWPTPNGRLPKASAEPARAQLEDSSLSLHIHQSDDARARGMPNPPPRLALLDLVVAAGKQVPISDTLKTLRFLSDGA